MISSKTDISGRGDCLQFETLQRYANGSLSDEEAAMVKQHILECEICADILDGLQSMPAELDLNAEIETINLMIDEKALSIKKRRITITPSTQRMIVAAVLLTLVISTIILINFNAEKNLYNPDEFSQLSNREIVDETIAKETEEQTATLQYRDNANNSQYLPGTDYAKPFPEQVPVANNELVLFEDSREAGDEEIAMESTSEDVAENFDRDKDQNTLFNLGGVSGVSNQENASGQGAASPPAAKADNRTASTAGQKDNSRRSEKNKTSAKKTEAEGDKQEFVEIIDAIDEDSEDLDVVSFAQVEVNPQFPGGENAMLKFISSNIKYPAEAKSKGIEGKVFVEFVVGVNGKVSGVKVLRGVDPLLNAEAVRVVSMLPDFIPGSANGKPVAVSYVIPVTFSLK